MGILGTLRKVKLDLIRVCKVRDFKRNSGETCSKIVWILCWLFERDGLELAFCQLKRLELGMIFPSSHILAPPASPHLGALSQYRADGITLSRGFTQSFNSSSSWIDRFPSCSKIHQDEAETHPPPGIASILKWW